MTTRTLVNTDAVQTLLNKSLTAPAIASPAVTGGTFDASTAVADPLAALGLATKEYVDAGAAAFGITNYTTTGTLGSSVRLALLSSASFTITLPAAASMVNRTVTIKHSGTSLSQVYTIKGNASEQIISSEGTANIYILYTRGEEITLICEGTYWYVINHLSDTPWVNAGVMTITGVTSNPTKATTPDLDQVWWRRVGNEAQVKWLLQYSSAAGAADGSGAYLFALPTGISLNSGIVTPVATGWATATMSEGIRAGLFGIGKVVIDSTQHDNVVPFAYDTTHIQWIRDSNTTPVGSGGYAMTNNEMGYYLEARFPAANWAL